MLVDIFFRYAFLLVPLVILVVLALRALRIADQYERAVVFQLGRYNRTAGPGV